jgi:heavy metal translocating P-type ATPase
VTSARLIAIAKQGIWPLLAAGVLLLGAISRFTLPDHRIGPVIWFCGLLILGAPVVWRTIAGMVHGEFASDVVAMLAIIVAAVTLQPLAGLVIVLMQTGGEALERYAEGRASNAVRELEAAAPRIAHRVAGDAITDIAVDQIVVDDRLLVRPGEMFPCDAEVLDGRSDVDVSRLTGEPVPVSAQAGTTLPSGALNGQGPLTVKALKLSKESLYARIVELVRSAQGSKAPLQRLADQYAVWFTPITIGACALSFAISRDWLRVLAVLVVATPCPLILATPVAIIGGINRAARRMIIVRTGSALESLAKVHVAVFDKTGTLTVGRPVVERVEAQGGADADATLRLAAAVETQSGHLLARTLVEASTLKSGAPPEASEVNEAPGRGIVGTVEGHVVAVGSPRWLADIYPDRAAALGTLAESAEGLRAFVVVDGAPAAIVYYADALRPGVQAVLARLKRLGVNRTLLLSGDHAPNAEKVAAELGITEVKGDLLPQDKTAIVQAMVARGDTVLMVGDGTNDAPALAAASVGIALAGHGGGITAEAADAVILVDDVDRVADAIEIGRRTIRVARQSIGWGLGLSAVAMVVAGLGFMPPVIGALVQEGIDVAVILNALRTSRA